MTNNLISKVNNRYEEVVNALVFLNSIAGAYYWVNSLCQFVQRSLPCSWIVGVKGNFNIHRLYRLLDLSTKHIAQLFAFPHIYFHVLFTNKTFIQISTINVKKVLRSV